jgi:hypothetical protein
VISVSAATQQLVSALGGITGTDAAAGETLSNQADLDALKRSLLDRAEQLDQAELKSVTLAGSEFGGSPLGLSLADHHGRARRVIVETILGVVADLNRYRDGVDEAVRLLDTVDYGSADTLERTRERVESEIVAVIGDATSGSEAGQQYDEARNSEANQGRQPGAADDVLPEVTAGNP